MKNPILLSLLLLALIVISCTEPEASPIVDDIENIDDENSELNSENNDDQDDSSDSNTSNDQEDSNTPVDLVGTWKLISATTQIKDTTQFRDRIQNIDFLNSEYNMVISDSIIETSGSYDLSIVRIFDGVTKPTLESDINDISTTISYTNDDDLITKESALFIYEEAWDEWYFSETEESDYSIDGNTLSLTQYREVPWDTGLDARFIYITSSSEWVKQ